ncbi:type II toxin-antitoxin system VapB family antitoxin [Streptomyces sp. NPDC008238]
MDDALPPPGADARGSTPKQATVNGAPAESVATAQRRRFIEMLDEGAFDDVRDAEVAADAWR